MSNLIETASAAHSFKTLVTAVKAVGLVETLAERGPFTIFAPNDAAFAKLAARHCLRQRHPSRARCRLAFATHAG